MGQSVVKSVFAVIVFWWLVLAAYGFFIDLDDLASLTGNSVSMALLTFLGVIFGLVGCWFYIWLEKRTKKAMLSSDVVRGLTCTIGDLPIIALEPPQADELPDFSSVPDVPPNFFPDWFAQYDKTHPAHTALVRAVLKIFEYRKALPATHVTGGHGGRTLLQHSLLAAFYMDKLSRTWVYSGLRDKSGNRAILKLRDQAYQFDPIDPMVVLIGLAHDIGKIEAYIFDKKDPDKIIGIHHEHDLTGARMLSRLAESWAIPDEDRQAMFLSIAHYHHPMELPLSPDRRACDDRTIALMELMIKTDFVTSRVEAKGVEPTDQDYEDAGKAAATTELSVDALWKAFSDIITEHGRINSPDPRFNVATLCHIKGFNKPMLLMKEGAIRSALAGRLGLGPTTLLGDGRYQLTVDLLKLLDQHGILVKSYDKFTFSPVNALWNIDFMTRNANGAAPNKKTGWSAVIVIDPKPFPRVEQMEPYWWFAAIARGTMGAARAINKKDRSQGGNKPRNGGDLADDFEAQLEKAKLEFSGVLGDSGLEAYEPSQENRVDQPAAPAPQPAAPAPQPAAPAPQPAAPAAQPAAPAPQPAAPAPQPAAPAPQPAAPAPKPAAPAPQPAAPAAQPAAPAPQPAAPAPQPAAPAPAAAKPRVENLFPLLMPVWAEPKPPGPAPAPLEVNTVLSASPPAEPEAEPLRAIAPIDVSEALKACVQEANTRGATLRLINGRYLVSRQTLETLVPTLDWAASRYKIEQMTKTSKLNILFIPTGEGEDFALAFKLDDLR